MKPIGALFLVWVLLAEFSPNDAIECFDDNGPGMSLREAVQAYAANNTADTEVAKKFGYPIGSWCVDQVAEFNSIFQGLSSFNEPLTKWNTTKATTMAHMFQDAASFNQPLNHFVTTSVKDFRYMFFNAWKFNRDISGWNLQSARYLNNMFGTADPMYDTVFSRDLCAWGTYADSFLNVNDMFTNSDCPDTDDPNLTLVTPGPFCYYCPATCASVSSCVSQLWDACSIKPPCNMTSACFTTALQGCCADGKPSSTYSQQVRDEYAQKHCTVSCKTPTQCASIIWDNCEPVCNVTYKCFQNGVKSCCTGAFPAASYIDKVEAKYMSAYCPCVPMPSDPVGTCALKLESQCSVGLPDCALNSTCLNNVTAGCCRTESLEDFTRRVREAALHKCRGCTPPPQPVAACVRKVKRTCNTCRLRANDECVRGVVMKCCLPGPQRLWMGTVRDRYRQKYCNRRVYGFDGS